VWTDGNLTQWNPTNGFVLSWIPAARIVARERAAGLLDAFEAAISSSVYLNWYGGKSRVGQKEGGFLAFVGSSARTEGPHGCVTHRTCRHATETELTAPHLTCH